MTITTTQTTTSNYWTENRVNFADGSMVVQYVAGPLRAGWPIKHLGQQGTGDLREQTISKARYYAAIKADSFTRR